MPGRPEPGTQIYFHARQFACQPRGYRAPAAINVPGHDEVTHDKFAVPVGPSEILANDGDVVGDFSQSASAGIVAEFEIRQPHIEHAIQEFAGLPRAMRIDVAVPSGSIGVPKPSAKGAVILLVDDDSAVREVTASILRDLGHVVIEVGSGGGALDRLDRNAHIDLVILDFAMPGMNGMEVARQVRTKVPSCPVVFVTGYADTSGLEDIDETQIVRKPFIGNELADKVQIALANRVGNSSSKIIRLRR